MSQAPAMPLWTDALIGDTTHLSAEEFGAYLLILIATWRNNGQPFADNPTRLARICRMPEARWIAKLRPALVMFYDLSDGTWRQKRLQKEWNLVAEKIAQNREKGKLSGAARRLKKQDTEGTDVPLRFEPEDEPNANNLDPDPDPDKKEKEEPSSAEVVPLPARESAQEGRYAFEGKVIRLTPDDFNRWRDRFGGIADIAATLTPLDEGMALENPRPRSKDVFFRASAYLDKKHQEAIAAKKRAERPLEERYPNEDPAARSKKPAEFGSDFVPAKEFSDDPLAPPWMRRRA